MSTLNRRDFLATSAGLAAATGLAASARAGAQPGANYPGHAHRGTCFIGSQNAIRVVESAMGSTRSGTYLLDAIVDGIAIVENDPNDDGVGLGGLPNEEGVVQLDASCMDGRLHRAGSVGCIEDIKNPAGVALQVLRRTDHVMIVGPGAKKFALRVGFKEEDLLTDKARQHWLNWRSNIGHDDDWLGDDERDELPPGTKAAAADIQVRHLYGTVHCSGVDGAGNVAAVTSTSGLSWKLPGRLGDSPIVGAGMYCDNAVGSAGATGRGEAVIQVCGAFSIVQHMEAGLAPTEACLAVLKRMADRTREKRLRDDKGRPNFQVKVYALRKDGAYGSAALWGNETFAVNDGERNVLLPCASLYERK